MANDTKLDPALQVALLETDCPKYPYLDGAYPEPRLTEEIVQRLDAACETCKGTGKVPLLPEMRLECPCISQWRCNTCDTAWWSVPKSQDPILHVDDCTTCQGRGWVASKDLATLLVAMGQHGVRWDTEWVNDRTGSLDGLTNRAFEAAYQALKGDHVHES